MRKQKACLINYRSEDCDQTKDSHDEIIRLCKTVSLMMASQVQSVIFLSIDLFQSYWNSYDHCVETENHGNTDNRYEHNEKEIFHSFLANEELYTPPFFLLEVIKGEEGIAFNPSILEVQKECIFMLHSIVQSLSDVIDVSERVFVEKSSRKMKVILGSQRSLEFCDISARSESFKSFESRRNNQKNDRNRSKSVECPVREPCEI